MLTRVALATMAIRLGHVNHLRRGYNATDIQTA
jgi:hypothetical protein